MHGAYRGRAAYNNKAVKGNNIKTIFERARLALALLAGCCAASVAHADTAAPEQANAAASAQPAAIDKRATLNLGFERIALPGNEAMGLVGTSYLIEAAPNLYLGPAAYGAVSGQRGGFFTVGGELAWRQPLVSRLDLVAGIYGGGGGGSAASVGGGLMLRPHLDLLWGLDGYHVGLSAARVRFPNGSINSSQLGVLLSADSDFSYYRAADFGQKVEAQGRSGVGFDRVLIVLGAYRTRPGTINATATGSSGNFGFVGARMEQFYTPHLYRGIEVNGGAGGGVAGYAEYLATLGAEAPLWNDNLALGARVALGMGGGGGVPVGGGGLLKLGAYASANLSRDARLALEGGYASAPSGNFRATYGAANLVWELDHPYAPTRVAEIVGNEWVLGSEHYFGAARKDGSSRDLDAVVIKLNRYLTPEFYFTGQAHSAYSGNAGAYSAGLIGAGYRSGKFFGGFSAGAELLAGASGGGGVASGNGAIIQPMAYLALDLTEDASLRLDAGKIKALNGTLNSRVVGLSFSFAYGTARR